MLGLYRSDLLITTEHALTLVMFMNVANFAQTHKYVAFALRCFGRNIGWMNRSPTKSKTLSHPGIGIVCYPHLLTPIHQSLVHQQIAHR